MRGAREVGLAGALAAVAVAGAAGCTGLPAGASAHPDAGQPATPFSMAAPRCAAQGKQPAVQLGEEIGRTRFTDQPLYRGASLICQ